jgi:ATP-dependent Clp protease ATP-binding subunit ClpC
MFERFSDPARLLIVQAQEEARVLEHGQIGTEHLLLAAARLDGAASGRALIASGVTYDALLPAIETATGKAPQPATQGHIPFTGPAKKALENALREAQSVSVGYIGTAHVLLGLTDAREGLAFETLVMLGVDIEELRSTLALLAREAHESLGGDFEG